MTFDTGIESNQENRTLAMVACLLGIVTNFVGPLVVWLLKKDQSRFVAFHAFQTLLFNVAILAGYAIAGALTIVLIGFLLIPVLVILHVVFLIITALAANRGEWYEIPVVGKYARQAIAA